MSYSIVFLTRFLSLFVGILTNFKLPLRLNQSILGLFIKAFKVDLQDVELPLTSFRSLGEFFLRELRPTARPVSSQSEAVVCSPVDGVMRSTGHVDANTTVLVKGQNFDWKSFLLCPNLEQEFRGGTFFNFYLSPRDYHHVHFPIAGQVKEFIHHPGGLLPVNDWSIKQFPNLFCFNERIVTIVETPNFRYLIIMIGALNVGSIALAFEPNFRRSLFATKQKRHELATTQEASAGDRFGSFRLGSSVVCVFPPGVIEAVTVQDADIVKYGSKIAKLL